MFMGIIFSLVLVVFALPLACGRQTGGAADLSEQPLRGHHQEYDGPYVPGEVLVKFKGNVNRAEVDELAAKHNCRVEEFSATIQLYRLKILDKRDVRDVAELFAQDPRVEYAEPNFIDRPTGGNAR